MKTIERICEYTGFTLDELKKQNRSTEILMSRQIIMEYLYSMGLTYVEIGEIFDRNHSTVINAVNTVQSLQKNKSSKKFNKIFFEFTGNMFSDTGINDEFLPFIQKDELCTLH